MKRSASLLLLFCLGASVAAPSGDRQADKRVDEQSGRPGAAGASGGEVRRTGAAASPPSAAPSATPPADRPTVPVPVPPNVVPPDAPPGATPPAPGPDDTATLPPPSSAAQELYSSAQSDLLQIRMLLRNGRTQSTVGSGFLVGESNLVVTNYHVVSQMALDPDVYIGEYVDTDGNHGAVELMAVDVLRDLAVLRVNRSGTGFFKMPEQPARLLQGQKLYSLGNPLDLGFAISEGAYNGVVSRSFYDQLIFSGPINSGMSGGPSITATGMVAGVNVSKRRDGEAVSFLVPVKYAQELLRKVTAQAAPPKDFNPLIAEQLLAHQRAMVGRLLDTPLAIKTMGPYRVPVRESGQLRCWGRSNVKAEASFSADVLNCATESAIYVSATQQTGNVSMSHQYLRSATLHPLRFAALASSHFGIDRLGNTRDSRLTGPLCSERFVHTDTLALRAVTCVRAYRKFPGLYNFTLLTASTDNPQASLQSRLDVAGVSYENGMRVTRAFLNALGRSGKL